MRHRSSRFRVCALLLLFFAAAFLLPASRNGDIRLYVLAAAVPGVTLLLLLMPAGLAAPDRASIAAAMSLCGLGIMAPAFLLPDEAVAQAMRAAPCLVLMFVGAVLSRSFRPNGIAAVIPAFLALMMLSLPLMSSPFSFSLTHGGIAMLMLALAAFLSARLRLPALFVSLGGLALLLLQHETGAAAIWAVTLVLIFWAVSDSALWSGFTLLLSAGLFVGFLSFLPAPETVREPLLQRFISMPFILPELSENPAVSDTGSLFFLLGDQYGLALILCALLILCLLLIRAASVALHTRKAFHASLALGCLLFFGLKALWFLLCVTDIVSLSPGSFPLLSSSLPELAAEFFLVGILSGVSARNDADLTEDARLAMLAR